jgi:uroporphyrin-III C-methyltransferase
MSAMETENPAKLPAPENRGVDGKAASRSSRGRLTGTLVLLVVLALAAVFVWWYLNRQTRERDSSSRLDALATQVDQLARGNEQLRRDIDSLRSRYTDSESMSRGIREEVLGFNERSRALEDAVANLADQRLSNRDAMALNEAEFILQLAGERLALFRDASGTLAAYRLADSALASAEDPLFANVRQTISAEMQAIEAAKPMQTRATLNALAKLRASLASLPLKASPTDAQAGIQGERSRLRQILSQFVRISHDDDAAMLSLRDEKLTRSLAALDLRAAEAAVFVRDQDEFEAALKRARSGIEAVFDTDAPAVREALATLDRLAATPLAPALPELGTALNELRNLRTTRALSQPARPPATTSEAKSGANP